MLSHFLSTRFRSLATAFFRNAMGFILVYDITNRQSFVNIRDWLEQLRTHSYSYEPLAILVGNKTDLHLERSIEKSDGERLATKCGMNYIETSAKSGENVREAVDILLDLVWDKMMKTIPAVGDPLLHSLVAVEDDGRTSRQTELESGNGKRCCYS